MGAPPARFAGQRPRRTDTAEIVVPELGHIIARYAQQRAHTGGNDAGNIQSIRIKRSVQRNALQDKREQRQRQPERIVRAAELFIAAAARVDVGQKFHQKAQAQPHGRAEKRSRACRPAVDLPVHVPMDGDACGQQRQQRQRHGKRQGAHAPDGPFCFIALFHRRLPLQNRPPMQACPVKHWCPARKNILAALFVTHQARVFQNGKMVGDGGSAGAELFGYLTGAFRPSAQQLQDLAAGGVGQGFERFVEHARTAPSAAFLSTLV